MVGRHQGDLFLVSFKHQQHFTFGEGQAHGLIASRGVGAWVGGMSGSY